MEITESNLDLENGIIKKGVLSVIYGFSERTQNIGKNNTLPMLNNIIWGTLRKKNINIPANLKNQENTNDNLINELSEHYFMNVSWAEFVIHTLNHKFDQEAINLESTYSQDNLFSSEFVKDAVIYLSRLTYKKFLYHHYPEIEQFDGNIDEIRTGHIHPTVQSILLSYPENMYPDQSLAFWNPMGFEYSQSRVFMPFIWKTLSKCMPRKIPKEWTYVTLKKEENIREFDDLVEQVINYKDGKWCKYAHKILTTRYDLNDLEKNEDICSTFVLNESDKIIKEIEEFQGGSNSFYEKYKKYKFKYLDLKKYLELKSKLNLK